MNRLRMMLGNQTGRSGLVLWANSRWIEMSVKSRASQVITPTVKSNREIAFDRTGYES